MVHHEDEDKANTDPANLKVFANVGDHNRYHAYLRREARGVIHLFGVEVWLDAPPLELVED